MIVDAIKCLSKKKQWSTSDWYPGARTIQKYLLHCQWSITGRTCCSFFQWVYKSLSSESNVFTLLLKRLDSRREMSSLLTGRKQPLLQCWLSRCPECSRDWKSSRIRLSSQRWSDLWSHWWSHAAQRISTSSGVALHCCEVHVRRIQK